MTVALPYTPLAGPLGLAPIPGGVLGVLALLALLAVLYLLTNEAANRRFPPDRLTVDGTAAGTGETSGRVRSPGART